MDREAMQGIESITTIISSIHHTPISPGLNERISIQFGRNLRKQYQAQKLKDWKVLQTHSRSKPIINKHQKLESENSKVENEILAHYLTIQYQILL